MPLTKWIEKLEKVQAISERAMEEAVEQSEDSLVQLQKDRMDLGLDVNGQPIEFVGHLRSSPLNETGAYTRGYSKSKAKNGGQTKFVDLEGKTKKYKKSLKAKTTRGNKEINVDIESDVPYAYYINKNYDNLYGLDKVQQSQIESDIAKKIEEKVTNFLNL